MLISAVVPVYNTDKKHLDECLTSIINQTYPYFEVILVDDGSNEECARYCDEYEAIDPRITLIHQANSGVSAARNTGLSHIHGEVLTFVDSDDSLLPNAWKIAIDALTRYDVDLAIFGWTDYCESDTYVHTLTDEEAIVSAHELQVAIGSDNYKCGGGYPWNKLWRVSSLVSDAKSIPSYDPALDMYEDKLWVLQALSSVRSGVLLPQLLYNYNFVSSSITQAEETRIPRLLVAYDSYKIILDYLQEVNDEAYVMAYNFCFEFTCNDIRYLSENKSLHRSQIKQSKKALKRLCKRIRPRTLYVPIRSKEFLIWAIYHFG